MPDIKGQWIIFADNSAARWAQVVSVTETQVVQPYPAPPITMTRCLFVNRTAVNVADELKTVVEALINAGDG